MPKLGVFSGGEICELLRAHGFELVRQRGSHLIMQRRAGETTITVPVPNHRETQDWHPAIHYPPEPVAERFVCAVRQPL